jgi:hypothetical protein
MRAIDQALVDEVWREMTTYPSARTESEAGAFLDRQPHVATFTHTVMAPFEPPVQQAALGLAFLLFKILERSLGQPFPALAAERVTAAYEKTRVWLDQTGGGDAVTIARSVEASAHPSLIGHILRVFYGGEVDPAGYDERVKASFVLLLSTLVDALDLGEVEGGGSTLAPSAPM